MHLLGEHPWSVCPVYSDALSASLAQAWLEALSSTRHLSWLPQEVLRGWLWPHLGTGAGPDLNCPYAPWGHQPHIPPAIDCDTIYSIFNRGKKLYFQIFQTFFFFLMAYGKLAGSGMGWRAQWGSSHQHAPAPMLATLCLSQGMLGGKPAQNLPFAIRERGQCHL